MIFSKGCIYAIRASLYLASGEQGGFMPIREISKGLGLSHHFLTKILQHLTQAGLLNSMRGTQGGVTLARSPSEIRLEEIVVAIDGRDLFEACILGLPGCGTRAPCPMHEQWSGLRTQVHTLFATYTLADLSRKIQEGSLDIKDLLNESFKLQTTSENTHQTENTR